MAGDRYVVLGLAQARAPWFRVLAQWANDGSVPVELVKCITVEELRARLRSGRPHSAVVIDAQLPSLDRDLVETAHRTGCSVIVVDDHRAPRDWNAIGADVTLSGDLDRRLLLEALTHAKRIGRADAMPAVLELEHVPDWRGEIVMVCGPGGTGTSTASMGLAQSLASDVRNAGMVVLADLARRAEQGMLHDAADVVPGVQELVEAHRSGYPSTDDIRSMTFAVPARRYHLLIGLRRPHAWATIRPRAFEAALAGLCSSFRVVVCDTDADLEGELDGGSIDVEERNTMTRAVATAASVVFAVGCPGVKGVYSLTRVIGDLIAFGVGPRAIVPVINRAPRQHRARADLEAALDGLLPARRELQPCVFISERKIEQALRDGAPLPSALGDPLRTAYTTAVADRGGDSRIEPVRRELSPVLPGSLGTSPSGDEVAPVDSGPDEERWAAG